jgi:Glycyl-tRNA synthetase (class II)
MEIFDQPNNERFLPYIIETSAGLNRMMLAVLSDAYWEDDENNRVVMKLHPRIAPVTAVVCPLVKKDGLPEIGRNVMDILKPHFKVIYDQQGSIGKRYYRQDEAGTPYGITIDHQSVEDQTVTLRHRDSQQQNRVAMDQLVNAINDSMENYS